MSSSDNFLSLRQYVRYHMEPADVPEVRQRHIPHKTARRSRRNLLKDKVQEIGRPYEGFTLIFDTETTTADGQKLRFGTYQIRGIRPETRMALAKRGKLDRDALDTLQESGIFYNQDALSEEEVALLRRVAAREGMVLLPHAEFVRDVVVGCGRYWKDYWRHDGLIIGFNLPFDIGALAFDFWLARDEFYGGFGFKMCDCGGPSIKHCGFHPAIRIHPIAPKKHLIEWAPARIPEPYQRLPSGDRARYRTNAARFLDVSTLARALLGPEGAGTLENLANLLGVTTRKKSRTDHGGPLTEEYVSYAIGDPQTTWECYAKLRDLYRTHGIRRPIYKIYSEASLGKGYFRDLGVPQFRDQHSDFPPETIGTFMEAYYGGRSEARIRLSPREIIHCDFKSQYPTVNALMGLQDLLLAAHIETYHDTPEARAFLETVTLSDLQRPETWRRLRGVARIKPSGDILPVRGEFGKGGGTNIGVCEVESGREVWYSFADVIASKLLTGRCPAILETIELVGSGTVQTNPMKLFGEDRYSIDLARDDLFTRLIDLRSEIKTKAKDKARPKVDRDYCDGLQKALKLLAASTSYGALVEYVVEERAEERPCIVHMSDGSVRRRTCKVESAGPYFAGPIGVLIPAAGRLLLAIAERLATDRGIAHVFCDTDSMCFAKPDGMGFEAFASSVREITDWFTPLSPYDAPGSIFQTEIGEPGTRCLAISAKRYAFYRIGDPSRGEPWIVFQKISSHGMGAMRDPDGYRSIFPDAPPPFEIRELVTTGAAALVIYDVWREAVEAIEDGRPVPESRVYLRDHPSINSARIGTAHQLKLYDALPNARPFEFLSAIPPMVGSFFKAGMSPERIARLTRLAATSFYAPHANSFAEIRGRLRFRDTSEAAEISADDLRYLRFQTLEDRLKSYFSHPENKAFPPDGIGQLRRRIVTISGLMRCGKESAPADEYEELEVEEELQRKPLVIGVPEGMSPVGRPIDRGLIEALRRAPIRRLSAVTGIDRKTLVGYREGRTAPNNARLASIHEALATIEAEKPDKGAARRASALRRRIKQLGPGPSAHTGIGRVQCGIASQIGRIQFRSFMAGHAMLTAHEEAFVSDVVSRMEAEDALEARRGPPPMVGDGSSPHFTGDDLTRIFAWLSGGTASCTAPRKRVRFVTVSELLEGVTD